MSRTLAQWSFLLLVVSLPLVRPFNFSFAEREIPYTDVISLITLFLFAIAVVRRQVKLASDRFYVFIGLYALAFTISSFFSSDPKVSFVKLLGEYYLFTLCILTFCLEQDPKFIKRTVIAWLAGSGLTVLASFAGFVLFYIGYKSQDNNYFLSHFGSLPDGNYPRIHAHFANANMLCNYLNVSVILALLAGKVGWIRPWVSTPLLCGVLFAAVFSISPGLGGIALSIGLWLWAAYSWAGAQNKARLALGLAVLIATAFFAATVISPDTKNTEQDLTIPIIEKKIEPSVRVLVWGNALETAMQNPIVGKGTGMTVANLYYETLSGDRQVLGDAHNVWLNIFGQTGIVGLTVLLLLVIHLLRRCSFNVGEGDTNSYTHVALSCAFVGAFIYQGSAGSFEDARHLWLLIGMLAASSRLDITVQRTDTSPESIEP